MRPVRISQTVSISIAAGLSPPIAAHGIDSTMANVGRVTGRLKTLCRHGHLKSYGKIALSHGVYYAGFMSELDTAKTAQEKLTKAHENYMHAVNQRDTAVKLARQAGTTANQLAQHLGLSRQQIHKILKENKKCHHTNSYWPHQKIFARQDAY